MEDCSIDKTFDRFWWEYEDAACLQTKVPTNGRHNLSIFAQSTETGSAQEKNGLFQCGVIWVWGMVTEIWYGISRDVLNWEQFLKWQ